jgi:hypothetical protein
MHQILRSVSTKNHPPTQPAFAAFFQKAQKTPAASKTPSLRLVG